MEHSDVQWIPAAGGTTAASVDDPPEESGPPVLNEDKAMAMVGGDAEFMVTIFEIFLEGVPQAMEDIGTAVDASDVNAVDKAAHKLKGEVGAIGADAAFEAAKELNDRARQGEVDAFAAAWGTLQHEMARLEPVLRSYSA